jgi:ribonuclease P protein component
MAVSRKVGNAIVRNRVKRWIREASRRLLGELSFPVDVVLLVQPPCATAGYLQVESAIRSAFQRLNHLSSSQ